MEYTMIPEELLTGINDPYIITATGNSMAPEINEGDTVILDLTKTAKPNDIISCRLNGQFLLKILGQANTLKSFNPEYEEKQLTPGDDFEIMGRVARVIKKY